MQVIANKRLQFHRSEVIEHPKSKENYHIIHESFTVTPSPAPQVVPDWIKQDGLFVLAVKDKSIIPVAVLVEDEETKPESKSDAKDKGKDTGLSGWSK